jgi:hypothetical protein
MKNKYLKCILSVVLVFVCLFTFTGCRESKQVEYNIKKDADNYKVVRRLVALNTRTDKPLFIVEGRISVSVDDDKDLNVTIKTGDDSFKLFYAHLSKDITYTCVQIKSKKENPYLYKITYFPLKDVVNKGLPVESTK